jgi:hypothetical protein
MRTKLCTVTAQYSVSHRSARRQTDTLAHMRAPAPTAHYFRHLRSQSPTCPFHQFCKSERAQSGRRVLIPYIRTYLLTYIHTSILRKTCIDKRMLVDHVDPWASDSHARPLCMRAHRGTMHRYCNFRSKQCFEKFNTLRTVYNRDNFFSFACTHMHALEP